MVSKTKTKAKSESIKKASSVKGYKGKNYRESKVFKKENKGENKYFRFLNAPIKFLDDKEKRINEGIRDVGKRMSAEILKFKKPNSVRYDKFVISINSERNRKAAKLLPIILLALLALAIKNKNLISLVSAAYLDASVSNSYGTALFGEKVIMVINAFVDVMKKLDIAEKGEIAFTFLSLFLDEIPSLFKDYSHLDDIQTTALAKHIAKNANELNKAIKSPAIERKRAEQAAQDKNLLNEIKTNLDTLVVQQNKKLNIESRQMDLLEKEKK